MGRASKNASIALSRISKAVTKRNEGWLMSNTKEDVLKIEVTGKTSAIPVDSFLELVSHTVSILQGLDVSISQSEHATLEWQIIEARLNTPLMLTIEGIAEVGADISKEVIDAYLRGFDEIEKNGSNIPPYFTAESLQKAKNLASVLNDGISKVAFFAPNRTPVETTRRTLENLIGLIEAKKEEEALELKEATTPRIELHAYPSAKIREESTLIGRLETVTVHGGKPKFVIYDPLTEKKIDCFFSEKDFEEVQELLSLDPYRVSVTGKARYNRQGRPISIEVESFTKLRSREELPQFRDLEGINLSGELDPTEYIRRMRDE